MFLAIHHALRKLRGVPHALKLRGVPHDAGLSFPSLVFIPIVLALVLWSGCRKQPASTVISEPKTIAPAPNQEIATVSTRRNHNKYLRLLSEYNLYRGSLAKLEPAAGVFEYELNTTLFSDYSGKQRVIRVPEGKQVKYEAVDALDFPVGTLISKTFYYAHSLTDSARGRRLIETRILQRTDSGWIGLPYVWNEEQTDAFLTLAGDAVEVQWIHTDGATRSNIHIVPNLNDCKRCHQNESMEPLGPTARNLNRDVLYEHGTENQLAYWARNGLMADAPKPADAPKLAVWDDPKTGTLDERARAWLEVNCSHCHNPKGPARNSGLHLNVDVTDPYQLGVFKTPVAAGKGTGGRNYGIVPGKPDESILLYRLETTLPGALMPEFGRTVVHDESVALIRDWIEHMPVSSAINQVSTKTAMSTPN